MKNQLLDIEGTKDESQRNFETDNLDWDIDL